MAGGVTNAVGMTVPGEAIGVIVTVSPPGEPVDGLV
jgi:hypothetical protein